VLAFFGGNSVTYDELYEHIVGKNLIGLVVLMVNTGRQNDTIY